MSGLYITFVIDFLAGFNGQVSKHSDLKYEKIIDVNVYLFLEIILKYKFKIR